MNSIQLIRFTCMTTCIMSGLAMGCHTQSPTPPQTTSAQGYAAPTTREAVTREGSTAPLVDPSRVTALSLEHMLSYADTHAPSLHQARASADLARADVVEADIRLPANPQFNVAGGGRTVAGESGFEFKTSLQQRVEVSGESQARRDAAQSKTQLGAARVEEIRWALHMDVQRLYIETLLVQERRGQAERFEAFSMSLRDIAQKQVEVGESSPMVILVADTDLAQTREVLIEVRRHERALQARLASLIGWPDATLPPLQGVLNDVCEPPDVDTLLSLMATHHPSLHTRTSAIRAQEHQLALAEREARPEPTVGLFYGREAAPGASPEAHIWLVNLSTPLALWRTNQAGQVKAQVELEIARRQHDAQVIALRGQLTEALIELDAGLERVALYEQSIIPQVEQNLALLQRSYELGEIDVHQVSQTRERLLTVTGQYIDARSSYHTAVVTLEALIGTNPCAKAGTP